MTDSFLSDVADAVGSQVKTLDARRVPRGIEIAIRIGKSDHIAMIRATGASSRKSHPAVTVDPPNDRLVEMLRSCDFSELDLEVEQDGLDQSWIRWQTEGCPALEHFASREFLAGLRARATSSAGRALQLYCLGNRAEAVEFVDGLVDAFGGHTETYRTVSLLLQWLDASPRREPVLRALSDKKSRGAGSRLELATWLAEHSPESVGEVLEEVELSTLDPEARVELGAVWELLGEFDRAADCYRTAEECRAGRRASARLLLWRRDCPGVDELVSAESDPDLASGAAVLSGNFEKTLRIAEEAGGAGGNRLVNLWAAEAHYRRGEYARAMACLDHVSADGAGMISYVLLGATRARRAPTDVWFRRSTRASDFCDGLLHGPLDPLIDRTELFGRMRTRDSAAQTFEELLGLFGGNRSDDGTVVLRAGRLERVSVPLSARGDSSALQLLLRTDVDLVDLIGRFEHLAVVHPNSPHPWCYGGEVLLWMGEYSRARDWFGRAMRLTRTRWAFVGLAACDLFEGRLVRARAISKAGEIFCGRLPGSTVPVINGEIARHGSQHGRAKMLLERACSARPRRVGPRLSLILSLLSLGEAERAHEHWALIVEHAPGLVLAVGANETAESAEELREWSESALAKMRGNRSSWALTYHEGERMVVLPSTEGLAALATQLLRVG